MFKEKRTFENSRGLKLSAIYEGNNKNAPVVIICHGYGSNKTRISTRSMAKKLVNTGLSVYRFDFTGCGQSQGKLWDLTPLAGLDDLKGVVENLGREDFALVGSSFGGYVSLLYASKNPVSALVLRAAVSRYDTIHEEPKYKENMKAILKEVSDIDIYKDAKKIKCPTLLIHGDADEVVPIRQSKELIKSIPQADFKIIKNAPHVFRGKYLSLSNNAISSFLAQALLN